MKKATLFMFVLLIMFVFNSTELIADAANLIFTAGGNVKLMNSESIKMVKEKIDITMLGNHFEVRVDYVFYNSGEKQTAIMGFPNSRGTYGSPEDLQGVIYGIKDFRAFDGERELKIERKGTAITETTITFPVWETFMVDFEVGETKMITNIYSQKCFGGNRQSVEYILTTGATWKGSIDSIWVNIYSYLPDSDFNNRTVYLLEEGGDYRSYNKDEYRLYISPREYIIEDNVIKMMFTDVEPDFNIYITLPPPSLFGLFASSELDKNKNDKYAVKNLTDEDPSTAWVEGKKGSGINEYIKFYCPPPPEDTDMINIYSAYKINSLGIINGYAKSEEVFYNNNRVKKIRIEYENEIFREENPYNMKAPTNIEFILEDTMDLQYLAFPEPIYMSSMKISILEVYKGTKWDDTCISEIKLFTGRVED